MRVAHADRNSASDGQAESPSDGQPRECVRAGGDAVKREPRLEETKRIGRVLQLVQRIGSEPGTWTRRRLAGHFEVSERQIDYDLELIRHALAYDVRRKSTGYYFQGGPAVRPVALSAPEALGLALAAQLAVDTGSVEPTSVRGALGKLEAALPTGIRSYLRAGLGHAPTTGAVQSRPQVLTLLQWARVESRCVAVTYRTASRGGELTSRIIAPYELMPYQRSWMLIGADSLRGDVRMFKVDRIESAELTEQRYGIPGDFDLVAYMGTSWGALRGEGGDPAHVALGFNREAAPWVRDDLWHPSQEVEEYPDGGLTMRFHCAVSNELVRWVLSFGDRVRVEQPNRLRRMVVQEARRVCDAGV